MSSFVRGLNDELQSAMKVLKPKTVQEVVEGASLQELTFEALMRRQMAKQRRDTKYHAI